MAEVVWTRAQQTNALKAVEIVRAVVSSDDAAQNVAAAMQAVARLVPGGADATDVAFAKVAPDIITGLLNLAGTLAEHSAARGGVPVEQVIEDVVEAVRTLTIVG
jgi:hypothetical protein